MEAPVPTCNNPASLNDFSGIPIPKIAYPTNTMTEKPASPQCPCTTPNNHTQPRAAVSHHHTTSPPLSVASYQYDPHSHTHSLHLGYYTTANCHTLRFLFFSVLL
ncbi:hypothetical protein CIPAW_06G072800 [Carya illinoinensis]|uniref:Uncharacterized protein n=1 Tax=Carya illinoinensis TaxID=32201 RepID=A0A8T1Q8Z1_CARIL|nr:hypothetical protein CIPAW_06G072800 [Carya illinoinensis]